MFLGKIALYVVFLFALLTAVHAKDMNGGLYLTGVSISFLVFQNGIYGADAAWSKLKKQLKRMHLRERGNTGDEEESQAIAPAETEEAVPHNIKKLCKKIIVAAVFAGFPSSDYSDFQKHLNKLRQNGDDAGEEAVREVFRWSMPIVGQPHPLDEVFPEGGKLRLMSSYSSMLETFSRLPSRQTVLPLWRVTVPTLGEVTIRRVEVPKESLVNAQALEKTFMTVLQQLFIPSPIGDVSPVKAQVEYGLQTIIDILRVKSEYLVENMETHDRVVFNVFILQAPTECTLPELLSLLNTHDSPLWNERTVFRARVSLTFQLLRILGKLRHVRLVPPRMTPGSFTLSPAGRLLLAEYAPLLKERSQYLKYEDGELVESSNRKRQKKKAGRGVPHTLDLHQPDLDAVTVIYAVWCSSDGIKPEGEATASTTDVVAAESAGSSEVGAEAAASSLTLEEFDCSGIPPPVLELIAELKKPDGVGLAGITSHRAFKELWLLL